MCQSADHRSILETFGNPSQPIKAWNFGIVAGFRKLEEYNSWKFSGPAASPASPTCLSQQQRKRIVCDKV